MNIHFPQHQSHRKSLSHNCQLFTDITKRKRTENNNDNEKEQKMICTADTLKNYEPDQSSLSDFDFHFENKLRQFKMMKAEQIADIAYDGDIPVKNIIKRIHSKLQAELFKYIQSTITQLQIITSHQQKQTSVQRRTARTPKQLGSTIQHALTPKSIQTLGFEFQSSSQQSNRINEFSIGLSEFTLGNNNNNNRNLQQQQGEDGNNNKISSRRQMMMKGEMVSEFSVGVRNPTSKRIKDKIMNSKRTQQ